MHSELNTRGITLWHHSMLRSGPTVWTEETQQSFVSLISIYHEIPSLCVHAGNSCTWCMAPQQSTLQCERKCLGLSVCWFFSIFLIKSKPLSSALGYIRYH